MPKKRSVHNGTAGKPEKVFPFNTCPRLTPWSRVLLEKLTVGQLARKFSAFNGTRRFITVFTKAQHAQT
jgi:hypothetical protein